MVMEAPAALRAAAVPVPFGRAECKRAYMTYHSPPWRRPEARELLERRIKYWHAHTRNGDCHVTGAPWRAWRGEGTGGAVSLSVRAAKTAFSQAACWKGNRWNHQTSLASATEGLTRRPHGALKLECTTGARGGCVGRKD